MSERTKQLKFIITGPFASGKHKTAKFMADMMPNTFKIGRLTTSDPRYKGGGNYKYYTERELLQIFNNRQFIFIRDGFGLTTPAFEQHNLFVLSLEDVALVPNKVYANYEIVYLIIWDDRARREQIKKNLNKPYNYFDVQKAQKQILPQLLDATADVCAINLTNYTNLERLSIVVKYIETEDNKKRKKLANTEFSEISNYI